MDLCVSFNGFHESTHVNPPFMAILLAYFLYVQYIQIYLAFNLSIEQSGECTPVSIPMRKFRDSSWSLTLVS